MKLEAKLVTDFFLPSNCFLFILGQAFFWNWNINQFYTLNLGVCARPTCCQATLFRFLWRSKMFVPHTKKQQLIELKSIPSTMWVAYPQAIESVFYPHPWTFYILKSTKLVPFFMCLYGLFCHRLCCIHCPGWWKNFYASVKTQDSLPLASSPKVLYSFNKKLLIGNGF